MKKGIKQNTIKNSIKVLIAVLTLFLFNIGIVKAEPITITYDVDGGSEVSATVIEEGTRIGALPTTSKTGYALEGWYLDSDFNTRVSESTIISTNTELHAKWVVNGFPTLFKQDEATFDGTNVLRTGIRLYNTTNWEKDYEIGFTITEYAPSAQTGTQATFMNTKYENESLSWPGLVVRRTSKTDSKPERLNITQTINGTKTEALPTNITTPIQVKILRIDKKVYYEYKGGERTLLQDMSSFNQQFDTEVTFGASLDENNEIMRPFIGKISNMYIKMGKYQENTLTDLQVENETVTPAFNNSIFDYKTIVDKDTESVNVIATPGTDTIDVTNDGVHELHSGKNQIDIITTSSNGSIGVYTLEVLRNTTIPTDADCLNVTYNRSEQTLIPDSTLYDWVGGSNKQTNAGTYTLTARLKDGNIWSDGTTKDKTVTCSMNKATPTITVDKEITTIVEGKTDKFNVKASENGKFSTNFNPAGIAAAMQETTDEVQANTDTKITLAGTQDGTTTFTIIFTPTDITNYETVEKTINLTVEDNPYLVPVDNSYEYTGNYETFTAPYTGFYQVQLWGSQGGQADGTAGGKGAYTQGTIKLTRGETIYVYVGQFINGTSNTYGFNGGGRGSYSSHSEYNGNGGGATDVRLVSGEWDNETSLASRIMVAAGGGGAHKWGEGRASGGAGGALTGLKGGLSYQSSHGALTAASGGTQTSGGTAANGGGSGSFGKGGSSGNYTSEWSYYAGGGGGYYGGGGGGAGDSIVSSAAGGSSYISGYTGSVAIKSASDITPKEGCEDGTTNIECSYHYSGKIFTSPVMIAGNASMPNVAGTGNETGHAGVGAAKITLSVKEPYVNDLEVENYSFEEIFDESREDYKVIVDKDETSIKINIDTTENVASVVGDGTHQLTDGENKFDVTVTGNDGLVIVYQIEVVKNVIIPIDADCNDLTYNKQEQTLIADDTAYDWVSGANKQTNAGTYTLTARLKSGYTWADKTTDDKTVTCSMKKLTPVITLDKEINNLGVLDPDTFNEQASENGKFSSTVSTKGIVSITHDSKDEIQANTNNKVTITGAKAGSTTVTITFTPTDTNNMEIVQKSFDVTVSGEVTPDPTEEEFITINPSSNPDAFTQTYACRDDNTKAAKPDPAYETFTAPKDGYYKFELWGAQGGSGLRDGSGRTGGKGAYTKGIRYLHEGDTFYVYVGCTGHSPYSNYPIMFGYGYNASDMTNGTKRQVTCSGTGARTCGGQYTTGQTKLTGGYGGYNGGARGGSDNTGSSRDSDAAGGGGGSTDIRLVSGDFADFDSIKSRIMVAGGGAGGTYDYVSGHHGRGLENNTNSSGKLLWGQIGYTDSSGSGGGGGGYFGGKSQQCDGCLGYGGTSYISGAEGANSISEASVVDNVVLTGAKTHYSGVSFEDTVVAAGNQTMPNTAGTGTMTGKSGNGYAKITEAGISDDATLKRLSINGVYTDERLISQSGDQRFFNVTINKYEVEATIDVEPNSPSAFVTYQPNIKIPSGDSTRMITVVSEDGSVEIYQINIHRDPNDIDYLKDLTFNGQTVPGFNPDTLEYTVEIDPYDTETPNFEIGATKYSDEQEVTGLGSYTTRNGLRDYEVTVTSEDGTKTRTYIIHTDKAHTTKLKELEFNNITINPTFDKNVFEYNANIGEDVTYVNISKMIPWDSDATVVATGYSFIPTNRNGEITITVTAAEAEPSVYRIKIIRQNLPTDVKITTPEKEYIVPFESEFNLGTNIKGKKGKSYTVTFNYQDGRENTTGTYSDGYNPNGWLIKDVHYDNNATIIAIEDTVVSYDYSITGERIVLPEPESDNKTFSHWNSKSDGTGTHYTNESINKLSKNTTVYAIWDYEDVTIEFDSHGGSSVDSFTRKYKQEYGKLPTPTKEGYFFGGWYKEATYQNKVSAKTKATENITLHAQWIETNFPYVYPLHDSQYNCYGSVYIDTGIELYSQENWDKDYEIGFTIDEYNYNDQVKQATIVSDKYEVESLDYPGMAFRRSNDDFSKLEITQNQNGNKAAIPLSYTLPLKVRIVRIDKVVYYSINDGELTLLQDMSNFNQQHDIPVYFCAADNGNGGVQRLAKAKISNYYIKAGDYYEEDQEHSVTYPDGTVKMYPHNTLLQLESNTGTKDDEVLSTVTFKYHNGEEDTTSDVLKKYIPNGFDINSIHYDDEATLVVNEDKVIENSFDIEVVGAEFPEDPVKEGSDFSGWFTEETGGTKKTSYSGLSDITLHAQYDKETVIITTPEGEEEYPKGEEYTLGTNDITKDDATFDVTFKKHNGEEDEVKQTSVQYVPNGWLVNGVHYQDGGKFVVEDDTIISPDYIEISIPVEFPDDPEKEGHNFTGWYDSVTGGHEVTGYDRSEEFTLHAQWELKILDVTTPEGTEEVPYGTDYTLGTNNTPKESDAFDVTFKYHDNVTDDRVEHVGKDYTPHGWRVNGSYYPNNATFTVLEDTVIEPNYKETILEGEWPSEPTNGDYMFVGWFDQEENGIKYESFEGLEEDTVLHARWKEKITIITPDGPIIVPKGEEYELPTNDKDKDTENVGEVTFKLHNEEDDIVRYVTKTYTKNGWLINGVHYDDKAIITPEEDIELIPDYIETIIPAEFPNDPEKQSNIFNGWFDQEEGGNKYTEYSEEHDITLHAQWTKDTVLPTDIELDSDDITIVVGETHQIEVTFTPDGSTDTLTYNDFDKDIISLTEEGLVTGLEAGETTITIGTENTDIEKTINVTVIGDKITSQVLDVKDKTKARIIIGEEPNTSINDFLDKIDNPKEYLVVYDKYGNQIYKDEFDSTIVTTGMKVKLVINGIEHDEVIAIIRGDLNEDGRVNVMDLSKVSDHILEKELIEGYKLYAADLVEDPEAEEDEYMINVMDQGKFVQYILENIDSLNE